jgi:hypothetical protein
MRNVKSHFFYEKLNENQTNLEEFQFGKIQENLERNPINFKFAETSTDLMEFDADKTSIVVKLKIPEISIRYKKTFWKLINDLWVNFIALFTVTFFIANVLLNRLFESRWIMARKENCLKQKEF